MSCSPPAHLARRKSLKLSLLKDSSRDKSWLRNMPRGANTSSMKSARNNSNGEEDLSAIERSYSSIVLFRSRLLALFHGWETRQKGGKAKDLINWLSPRRRVKREKQLKIFLLNQRIDLCARKQSNNGRRWIGGRFRAHRRQLIGRSRDDDAHYSTWNFPSIQLLWVIIAQ